ncbi:MAG TPA: helix-turn-helix domain-containing protein [Ramlibacter sp.]|jgi:AraC-like DNA-binding protein|nr:helix-turn-helix domain-containing protein [Ramlibacter sp.]
MTRVHTFATSAQAADANTVLFQEQMSSVYAVGLAISSPGRPFHTQVTGYRGRQLRFAALRFSPHTTSSSVVGRRPSRLLVSLQKEGVALVQQDGRENRIEPGELFLIDPARPFSIETGQILTHSVYLEPEPLRSLLPDLDRVTARPVRVTEGAGAIFRAMVDEMIVQAATLQEDTADRMADALPHVLAAALHDLPAAKPSATRVRAMHKQQILRYLRTNLRNHELDARTVADGVKLSTRYVYELFEEDGQPLMKWVWSTRLDRCREDLASRAMAARSISEIAYSWGFNDVAHFSRAFRQKFGQSPREFRRLPPPPGEGWGGGARA